MKFLLAAVATMAVLDVQAEPVTIGGDALEWLKKIADSARTVSYSGTFVYQHGNKVETSRVVHYVNQAGGVFERLETLDGPPREVVRANDHVTAYIPDSKVVLVERRNSRHLPVMLPENLSDLKQQYEVTKLEMGRMGGFECVWIGVMPKDKFRYGRKFCAELNSGLPLRAQVFNESMQVVESFGFSQLTLGGKFNREQVASRYEGVAQAQKWRVDRSALNVQEQSSDTGWVASNLPEGFRKSMEIKRTIVGRSVAMPHLVYSDGLAAISVFVEPKGRDGARDAVIKHPLTRQGAVHIFKRLYGDYIVTVLGEAPGKTVMQIGNSMELKNAGSVFPK